MIIILPLVFVKFHHLQEQWGLSANNETRNSQLHKKKLVG